MQAFLIPCICIGAELVQILGIDILTVVLDCDMVERVYGGDALVSRQDHIVVGVCPVAEEGLDAVRVVVGYGYVERGAV